jgi:hypothetical protein
LGAVRGVERTVRGVERGVQRAVLLASVPRGVLPVVVVAVAVAVVLLVLNRKICYRQVYKNSMYKQNMKLKSMKTIAERFLNKYIYTITIGATAMSLLDKHVRQPQVGQLSHAGLVYSFFPFFCFRS